MKKIRVAVIGLGYWGPNLLRNFLKISEVEVAWICDISKKNLSLASSGYPFLKTTSDIDTVLKDKTLDLVAVATPLETHFQLAKKILLAKKNVLIEKPMASSSREAKELMSTAKKVKRQIFVGHTFVYSEPVRFLKKMVEQDELGKIYYFDSTRINLGLIQKDSNVLWDLAPHDISIILYIFSQKPLSVRAVGSSFLRKNFEELVHLFITLEKNITCHIQVSWISPVKMRNIVIAGSKKMTTYNDIEPTEKIRIYDKGVSLKKGEISPLAPAYRSGDITIPKIDQAEALQTELSHFVECLIKNKKPISGAPEGLEVVKIIEAAEKSLRLRKDISINDK